VRAVQLAAIATLGIAIRARPGHDLRASNLGRLHEGVSLGLPCAVVLSGGLIDQEVSDSVHSATACATRYDAPWRHRREGTTYTRRARHPAASHATACRYGDRPLRFEKPSIVCTRSTAIAFLSRQDRFRP
jgi:hypothetical protein